MRSIYIYIYKILTFNICRIKRELFQSMGVLKKSARFSISKIEMCENFDKAALKEPHRLLIVLAFLTIQSNISNFSNYNI